MPCGNGHSLCPAQSETSPWAEVVAALTLEKRSWRGIELNLPTGAPGTLELGSSGRAEGKGKRLQQGTFQLN